MRVPRRTGRGRASRSRKAAFALSPNVEASFRDDRVPGLQSLEHFHLFADAASEGYFAFDESAFLLGVDEIDHGSIAEELHRFAGHQRAPAG